MKKKTMLTELILFTNNLFGFKFVNGSSTIVGSITNDGVTGIHTCECCHKPD